MTDLRILAKGLRFPEGPVALPDGSVAVVEIAAARITRIGPDGATSTIAEVPGGPNGMDRLAFTACGRGLTAGGTFAAVGWTLDAPARSTVLQPFAGATPALGAPLIRRSSTWNAPAGGSPGP